MLSNFKSEKKNEGLLPKKKICLAKVESIESVCGNTANVRLKDICVCPELQEYIQTSSQYDQSKLTQLWKILQESEHYLTQDAVINLTVCTHEQHAFKKGDIVSFMSRIVQISEKRKFKGDDDDGDGDDDDDGDDHNKIKKNEKEIYTCDTCGKTYNLPYSLKLHKVIHTSQFQCKECGKCCHSKTALKIHIRTHTGEKPFKCKVPRCNRSYATRGNLKIHSYAHTDTWPYRCQFCDKGFAGSKLRNDHEKSHIAVRSFKCKYCQKQFSNKNEFKRHQNYNICGMYSDLNSK